MWKKMDHLRLANINVFWAITCNQWIECVDEVTERDNASNAVNMVIWRPFGKLLQKRYFRKVEAWHSKDID